MENNQTSPQEIPTRIIEPLTLAEIKQYRRIVASHEGNVSSKIILRLLEVLTPLREEIIKLRLAAVDKWASYDDDTPCPYGEHKGDRLADVPEGWLRWWYNLNKDRKAILFDMDFGPWSTRLSAAKKLKLHDYLKYKFNGHSNGNEIQIDRQGATENADDHYQD
jgi:hypothetical protein